MTCCSVGADLQTRSVVILVKIAFRPARIVYQDEHLSDNGLSLKCSIRLNVSKASLQLL